MLGSCGLSQTVNSIQQQCVVYVKCYGGLGTVLLDDVVLQHQTP